MSKAQPKKLKRGFLDRMRGEKPAEKEQSIPVAPWELTTSFQASLLFLDKCLAWLRLHDAHEHEGIFRKAGDEKEILALQQLFRYNADGYITDTADVHVVSSLLKRFFRRMTEPVIPFGHYQTFIALGHGTKEDQLDQLAFAIFLLPPDNRKILHELLKYLHEVASYHETSKMTSNNLAIVFAPNILKPEVETPLSVISDSGRAVATMDVLITSVHQIFKAKNPDNKQNGNDFSESMRVKYSDQHKNAKRTLVRARSRAILSNNEGAFHRSISTVITKIKIGDENIFRDPELDFSSEMERTAANEEAEAVSRNSELSTLSENSNEGDDPIPTIEVEDAVQLEIQRIMSQFDEFETESSSDSGEDLPNVSTPEELQQRPKPTLRLPPDDGAPLKKANSSPRDASPPKRTLSRGESEGKRQLDGSPSLLMPSLTPPRPRKPPVLSNLPVAGQQSRPDSSLTSSDHSGSLSSRSSTPRQPLSGRKLSNSTEPHESPRKSRSSGNTLPAPSPRDGEYGKKTPLSNSKEFKTPVGGSGSSSLEEVLNVATPPLGTSPQEAQSEKSGGIRAMFGLKRHPTGDRATNKVSETSGDETKSKPKSEYVGDEDVQKEVEKVLRGSEKVPEVIEPITPRRISRFRPRAKLEEKKEG